MSVFLFLRPTYRVSFCSYIFGSPGSNGQLDEENSSVGKRKGKEKVAKVKTKLWSRIEKYEKQGKKKWDRLFRFDRALILQSRDGPNWLYRLNHSPARINGNKKKKRTRGYVCTAGICRVA